MRLSEDALLLTLSRSAMLFNSLSFCVFFPAVTAGYFLLSHRWRWLWLLSASCVFYMYFVPIYILILGFTIAVDYAAGILIEQAHGPRRRLFLALSIAANVGVLAFFKYYNFLNNTLSVLLHGVGARDPLPYLSILLPIGLSFHTFQAMSYTIEVYRGHQKAERHFGIYALYVMFYPQLVAGPIERPQNLLHQFRERHGFDYDRVVDGLKLMAWGLFKKVVIADRLARVVDATYDHPELGNGLSYLIATVLFAFQIYCDFSGYSDIAIGAARVMGFKLMQNFRSPYQARSIAEFWHRWHISLSTWFRDYVYIPLGGNRVATGWWCGNLFIVFLVSGLWHGANWTYVVWGGLHGAYVVAAILTRGLRHRIRACLRIPESPLLQILSTFFLVSVAWVFFRAKDLHTAFYMLSHMVADVPMLLGRVLRHQPLQCHLGASGKGLVLCFLLIAILEAAQWVNNRVGLSLFLKARPAVIRWAVYYGAILAIFFLGVFEQRQFIYFQF